jgi:hypothetical protein
MKRLVSIPAGIAMLLVAAHHAAAQSADRHPQARYLHVPDVPRAEASLDDTPVPAPFSVDRQVLAGFGSEMDPVETTIGDIGDARFLPDGGVGLLDKQLINLRVFDRAGRLLQTVGRQGQGPEEFARAVRSLAVDDAGSLYVGDLSRSVKVFRSNEGMYGYARAYRFEYAPRSMCLLDSLLAMVAERETDPHVLHTFQLDGGGGADFGRFYESHNPGINLSLNRGMVACDAQRHLIYFALNGAFGEIRAFRPDGTPVWRSSIDGFRSNIIASEANGGLSMRLSPDGVHTVRSLVLIPGHGLLVQVGFATMEDIKSRTDFSTLTSFLLDPATGRAVSLGTSLPLIVDATASRVLEVSHDPYPRFEVHALSAKR